MFSHSRMHSQFQILLQLINCVVRLTKEEKSLEKHKSMAKETFFLCIDTPAFSRDTYCLNELIIV